MSKLSIIIINYNTGLHLKKCIDSIAKTTSNLTIPDSEVIIIDNDSKDNSLLKINSTKKIKVLKNHANLGFAKAVNQALDVSMGDYKLLLNPDTILKKHAIKTMLEFSQKTPNAGVVGARLLDPNGKIQASVIPLPTIWGAIKEFWLGRKNSYSKYKITSRGPTKVDSVVGAAFLVSPLAIKKVGKLNNKFFMYYEDIEYCKRVKQAGLEVYYLPQAEVIHYHGVSGKAIVNQSNQWKRLIPSSIAYHGVLIHYVLWLVLFTGQKLRKLLN